MVRIRMRKCKISKILYIDTSVKMPKSFQIVMIEKESYYCLNCAISNKIGRQHSTGSARTQNRFKYFVEDKTSVKYVMETWNFHFAYTNSSIHVTFLFWTLLRFCQ